MKLRHLAEMPDEYRVTWIATLWAALALLAAGAVLTGHHDDAVELQAPVVQAAVPAAPKAAITPSDPEAPAASDRLPPAP